METQHSGHGGHGGHGDHADLFRRKFWVSLALTIPTVVYSAMVQDWLGYTAPQFPGNTLVAPLFGTAVFVWAGRCSSRAAGTSCGSRRPG